MYQLTDEQKAALIARYSGRFHVPLLSYGTGVTTAIAAITYPGSLLCKMT